MITIAHLSKSRGSRAVLSDVTFEARAGRVTAFLGPNGAGKSSTLRILLGLDRATSGSALFDGKRYQDIRYPLTVVGAMLDGSGAHRSRTAHQHLAWVAASNGIGRHRVREVLEQVGLSGAGGRRAGTFSLGMGQRLGIAAALLGKPPTLVLDEPVNGLDPEGIRWMRGLLRGHADAGGTVLLSSHLMAEVTEIADDVAIIASGRIVAAGSIAEVTHADDSLEDAFFRLTDGACEAER